MRGERYIVRIMRIVLSIIAMLCAPAVAVAGGRVDWLGTKHDFGEILESEGKVTHRFMFVNTGDDDVAIVNVRPSCGCSVSDYPRRAIAPGDTAVITATFNPVARVGDFSVFFTVLTNCAPQRTVLELCGRVKANEMTVNEQYPVAVGSLKLNAGSVPFGDITEGYDPIATIEAYNDSDVPMKFYVDGVPEYVEVSPRQDVVAPRGTCYIRVKFATGRCDSKGYVADVFNMFAEPLEYNTSALAGIRRIDVMATIFDDFASWSDKQQANAPEIAFDADRLVYADLDTLSQVPVTRRLTIANRGNDPLRVYGIHSGDRYVSVGQFGKVLKSGESTTVDIAVEPSKINEKILNTIITIYCNDPRRAKSVVRVVGNLK